jgi:hypothetical protein
MTTDTQKSSRVFNRKVAFICNYLSSFKKEKNGWAPVACACNPSYSGGRDQAIMVSRFEASLGK